LGLIAGNLMPGEVTFWSVSGFKDITF